MNKIFYRFETDTRQFLKFEVFPMDEVNRTERVRVYMSHDRNKPSVAHYRSRELEYILIDDYTNMVIGGAFGETSEKAAWEVALSDLKKDIKIHQKKVDAITKKYHRDIAHLACLKRQYQFSSGEIRVDGYE